MGADLMAPVVLALSLREARETLAASGWACAAVVVTAPPPRRGEAPVSGLPEEDDLLVIRQQPAGGRAVRLTVARHPGGPAEGPPGEGVTPWSGR